MSARTHADGTPFALRAATKDDVPRLTALIAEANLPPLFIETYLDGFVVAEREGTIIACGAFELYEDACVVRSVAVDAAARGLGLGQAISERLMADARALGATEAYLFTQDAHPFWLRLGFDDVSLDEWTRPARASWQYQFIRENPGEFDVIHSMRMRLD